MSTLASQSLESHSLSSASTVPILHGSSNISAYLKALADHLSSNYGVIGQNTLKRTTTTIVTPGECPTYFDCRVHPLTRRAIPNTRKYIQQPKSEAQLGDPSFDDATLPLTADSDQAFSHDLATWHKTTAKHESDLEKYRSLDDKLLNFLFEHNSPSVFQILEANALMPAFKELPSDCITRSREYLDIIESQFSQGNSTVVIQELTKFLNLTQGPITQDPTPAFFNRLMSQFTRIKPLLEKALTVEALLQMLLCMVCIKGLNRSHPPTLRALLDHLQKFPGGTALEKFPELRASTLAAQDSDLSTLDADPISEQSSAFLSAPLAFTTPQLPKFPQPSPNVPYVKGLQKPGRTDHCNYCFLTFAKFFYHPETQCTLKKKGITMVSPRSSAPSDNKRSSRGQLAARVAALETLPSSTTASSPLPPSVSSPPSDTTLSADQVMSYLASHGWYPDLSPRAAEI